MLRKSIIFGLVITCFSASSVIANTLSPEQKLNQLADQYYQYSQTLHPEYAIIADEPDQYPDKFSDNSLDALVREQQTEDKMLGQLGDIALKSLASTPDRITYSVLKELLESARDTRVCRRELWDMNHQFGWQVYYPQILTMVPVETEAQRNNLLSRWQQLPVFLKNKQVNLTQGLELGYSVPKSVVKRLLKQLDGMLTGKVETSPFFSPATRSQEEGFNKKWQALVQNEIQPAIENYVNFLKTEYLPKARTELGLINHPNGKACYMAYYREWTGLKLTPEQVYNKGKELVAANTAEVVRLGKKLWQTKGFSKTIEKSKQGVGKGFTDSQQLLTHSQLVVKRAKSMLSGYFTDLPDVELKIVPYPDVYKGSGVPNKYQPPTEATPYGLYQINAFTPQEATRADQEVTAIHEGYPGHHLQLIIAGNLPQRHKALGAFGGSSFTEGWARYSEQLADEMGLYLEPASNVVRRAWPGRGMVVDPGLHLFGWSREQAVNYINESGRFPASYGEKLVDRIAVLPAQLTSYDSGALEFFRLRQLAKDKMGEDFDIRAFHKVVLENGIIPLSMLDETIKEWLNKQQRN